MTNHTNDHRVYAIGDIHGCLDQLLEVQANIARDLAARPHPSPVIVYLGDYIDRGPDSRGVIENLMAEDAASHHTHILLGNHDEMLLIYRDTPAAPLRPYGPKISEIHWLHEAGGGAETLRSYGVEGADHLRPLESHAAFVAALPDTHLRFFQSLELYIRIGSYLFVHAGIRPDVALDMQLEKELIWIREPFLSSDADHGFTVIHGHTPVKTVENRGNRIGIDTGAVFGGTLSCLVLEGNAQALLTQNGMAACPVN
ncbi:MAG: metallophosphoesterase family protein [Paracoccaceae bacterium]